MNGMALCAGVGGLELGLRLALEEYRCVCYAEREAYGAAILAARIRDGFMDDAPIWSDIETFDGRPWRGQVDIISAGFPCQPWSSAGRRQGLEDERWIWPEIARIVRDVRPRYVFLENSPRIVDGGQTEVLRDLALCGFNAEWDLFSAETVGAPHVRQRLFTLAHSDRSGQQKVQSDIREGQQDSDRGHNRCGTREAKNTTCEGSSRDCEGRGNVSTTRSPNLFTRSDWWLPEPDVPRVDDGTPHRVDRIRAIGNGVVPAVAATAFTILRGRLIE